jgi:hypothetical protein
MNKHVVELIRERFYPLVRFCGPQSAGEVEIEGVRGIYGCATSLDTPFFTNTENLVISLKSGNS